jgi:hypothetical protein
VDAPWTQTGCFRRALHRYAATYTWTIAHGESVRLPAAALAKGKRPATTMAGSWAS